MYSTTLSNEFYNDTTSKAGEEVVDCQFGWDYDKTDYESTIPSQFNWVCERNHFSTDVYTWTSVGNAFGTVLFGIAADKLVQLHLICTSLKESVLFLITFLANDCRFGRKPIFFASIVVNLLFKTASLFLPQHVYLFFVMQFLCGATYAALISILPLIAAEVCSPGNL